MSLPDRAPQPENPAEADARRRLETVQPRPEPGARHASGGQPPTSSSGPPAAGRRATGTTAATPGRSQRRGSVSRRRLVFVACVLLGVLAIGAVAALAASGLPGLGPGVEGEETQGPAGILGILDVRDRLPDVSAGRPSTEIGSQFLAGAAERLGLGNMPAGALPAAARAYRSQFGHSMDEDLPEHQDAIEEWLLTWRAAYDAGASWATGMAGP